MPFYKIRRYVLRAKHRLGYIKDSSISDDKYLIIMLFNILLLNYISCLMHSYK